MKGCEGSYDLMKCLVSCWFSNWFVICRLWTCKCAFFCAFIQGFSPFNVLPLISFLHFTFCFSLTCSVSIFLTVFSLAYTTHLTECPVSVYRHVTICHLHMVTGRDLTIKEKGANLQFWLTVAALCCFCFDLQSNKFHFAVLTLAWQSIGCLAKKITWLFFLAVLSVAFWGML